MNNTTKLNAFNSDSSNIANIKAQHQQIMTTIINIFLILKPMIKMVIKYIFFTVFTFSKINSFT